MSGLRSEGSLNCTCCLGITGRSRLFFVRLSRAEEGQNGKVTLLLSLLHIARIAGAVRTSVLECEFLRS